MDDQYLLIVQIERNPEQFYQFTFQKNIYHLALMKVDVGVKNTDVVIIEDVVHSKHVAPPLEP